MLAMLKSAAILALAALAIILTVQLWLVHIPNRAFFPYMQARFMAAAPPDEVAEFLRPLRVISGVGDGYFDIDYSAQAAAMFWEFGRPALETAMRQGAFHELDGAELAEIISDGPVLIFEYAFPMDLTLFPQFFGQRSATPLNPPGMTHFTRVIIRPDAANFSVTFVCDRYIWQYFFPPHLMPAVLLELEIPDPGYRRFVFNAGSQSFYPRFDINFTYHPVIISNPYQNPSGLLHLSFIAGRVEHFFNNPATINRGLSGGVYTFGNLNTVVRYLPSDVIEYTSFRTITRAATDFMTDFSVAHAFVAADPNVRNDFFLAGYERRGRENVFWFDYIVGNFPLVSIENWYTGPHCQDPLRHPIEVVVDHGRVVRYRKIAYVFGVDLSTTVGLALPAEAVRAGFPVRSTLNTAQHLLLQCLEHTP